MMEPIRLNEPAELAAARFGDWFEVHLGPEEMAMCRIVVDFGSGVMLTFECWLPRQRVGLVPAAAFAVGHPAASIRAIHSTELRGDGVKVADDQNHEVAMGGLEGFGSSNLVGGTMSNEVRNGAPWTEADVQNLKQLIAENTPTRIIGLKLGRTEEAMRDKVSALGLSLKPVNQSPAG